MNSKLSHNTIGSLDAYFQNTLQNIEERERVFIKKWIWEGVYNIPAFEILARRDQKLSESEILKGHLAVKQVLAGKPIQYVVGEVPFLDVVLKVNEAVLIPRPETEELVHNILTQWRTEKCATLDIGTGSGCIAIALSHARPQWTVDAWDVSEKALQVAVENNDVNGTRVNFECQDILQSKDTSKRWNLIISNPPYIPLNECKDMDAQVLDHEPHLALFTPNDDPLLFYRSIYHFACTHLEENGLIALEVHARYAESVAQLWQAQSQWRVQIEKDLQGKDRFVFVYHQGTH
jgi:release factor glutamine methyltransferase